MVVGAYRIGIDKYDHIGPVKQIFSAQNCDYFSYPSV